MTTYLLSGASGFIGSALTQSLTSDGHRVLRLHRGAASGDDVPWNPEAGQIDTARLALANPDVVINLAGEPIAQRWTADRKRRIVDSRVRGTAALASALAALPRKPATFVSGSAIGYYGANCGDEILTEDSAAGRDFLAETASAWEGATAPAESAGIRVVRIRTGLVLGEDGGALGKMLPAFKLGGGGRLATGRQWMSWISLTDMVAAIRWVSEHDTRGAVNVVAPEPVRNEEFTTTLGHVLGRPTIVPVPAVALHLLFGEMADATLLASQRVSSKRLAGAGFTFRHPRLEQALRAELRR